MHRWYESKQSCVVLVTLIPLRCCILSASYRLEYAANALFAVGKTIFNYTLQIASYTKKSPIVIVVNSL